MDSALLVLTHLLLTFFALACPTTGLGFWYNSQVVLGTAMLGLSYAANKAS